MTYVHGVHYERMLLKHGLLPTMEYKANRSPEKTYALPASENRECSQKSSSTRVSKRCSYAKELRRLTLWKSGLGQQSNL